MHLAADGRCRPLAVLLTPGHYGDGPQLQPVLQQVSVPRTGVGRPRSRPDHVLADKANTSRANRLYLRRRGISHTIPERLDQRRHRQDRGSQGGRPTGFAPERYKKRNTVERAINRLNGFRAVATRYEKRAYTYLGTVTLAALVRPSDPGIPLLQDSVELNGVLKEREESTTGMTVLSGTRNRATASCGARTGSCVSSGPACWISWHTRASGSPNSGASCCNCYGVHPQPPPPRACTHRAVDRTAPPAAPRTFPPTRAVPSTPQPSASDFTWRRSAHGSALAEAGLYPVPAWLLMGDHPLSVPFCSP
ncbi:hypothetical protein DMH25_31690 [Streptomyces sp. WAC 01325]|nr:hypothetical protein DMH25_31690 [Streptomyces sp. WAC 01325]